MAFQATVIASISLKPGTDIDEGEGAQMLAYGLKTISEQPGFQNCFYGLQHEHPDMLDLLMDWNTMDDHVAFTKTTEYKPFMQKLGESIMAGMPNLNHVRFNAPVTKVAIAPITEMLTFYFPADVEKSSFESIWERFIEVLIKNSDGCVGDTGGWVLEDVAFEGQPGKAYVAAIGWESIQAHMAYRETQAFKDSIPEVRRAARGAAMHHTKFTKLDKTFVT